MWGCCGVTHTCVPSCCLLIHVLVRNHSSTSHTHTQGLGSCLLDLYHQSISWSAHGVYQGGSTHNYMEDAGTEGNFLATANLILSASLSTPRSLASLTSFYVSFMLLDKLKCLFLKLLGNSLVPTVQIPPAVVVNHLSTHRQAGAGAIGTAETTGRAA